MIFHVHVYACTVYATILDVCTFVHAHMKRATFHKVYMQVNTVCTLHIETTGFRKPKALGSSAMSGSEDASGFLNHTVSRTRHLTACTVRVVYSIQSNCMYMYMHMYIHVYMNMTCNTTENIPDRG